LLTAKSSDENTIEGFNSGADDYIAKPFNASILKSRIRNILISRERLRKLFIGQLTVTPKQITLNSTDEKFMTKLLQVVEENLDNSDFSVEILADRMFMSRMNLFRKIKAITGENASDFISSMRLKKAAQLIAQTGYTFSEIAYMVGFNDPNYFSKCFKQYFGKTASEYRNN
jgi:YesN/AraC family two-component response regulator